jgi:hypothetical protein
MFGLSSLSMTTTDDAGDSVTTRLIPPVAAAGFLIQPRLLGPPDLAAWVRGRPQRWNVRVAIGTGAGDVASWEQFHVNVFALPEMPLQRGHRVDLEAVNVQPGPHLARVVAHETAEARR